MRKLIIFISGPMSGIEDYNRHAFFRAEHKIRELYPEVGVLNPAKLPSDLNPENYMPIDLAMVRESDIIVVLPGWEDHAGCRIEVEYAHKLGKKVCKYEEESA